MLTVLIERWHSSNIFNFVIGSNCWSFIRL